MRQRIKAMKERTEKKAKTMVVEGDREAPYDMEKVLEELGVGTTNPKENPKKKGKKAKNKCKQHKQIDDKVEPISLVNDANESKMPINNLDDNFMESEPEEASAEKNKNFQQNSKNGSKIAVNNLAKGKDANKVKENIPLEVLEYWENIERENQKHKETLGFMEILMKRCENLKIQNQNLELQNQTLQIQNKNFENENNILEAQAKNLEDAHMCKICMENEICFAFIPCGHLITCENCAVNGDLKICPMCRKQITKRLKTYLS